MIYDQQESKNLRYRKLTEEDLDSWEVFFESAKPAYMVGEFNVKTARALAEKWFRRQFYRYRHHQFGLLAAVSKKDDKLVGLTGLLPRHLEGKPELELAFYVLKEHKGQGYATEMARHFKNFVIDNKLSNRLVSVIHQENLGSIAVTSKIGFEVLFKTNYRNTPVSVCGIEDLY